MSGVLGRSLLPSRSFVSPSFPFQLTLQTFSAISMGRTTSPFVDERASYQPCDNDDIDAEMSPGSANSETSSFLEKVSFLPSARKPRATYYTMFLHGLIFGANLVFFLAVWRWSISIKCPYGPYGPDLVHSELLTPQTPILCVANQTSAPAKDAIAYESQLWDKVAIFFRNGSTNPDRYRKQFGTPSPELEEAWAKTIQCNFSKPLSYMYKTYFWQIKISACPKKRSESGARTLLSWNLRMARGTTPHYPCTTLCIVSFKKLMTWNQQCG